MSAARSADSISPSESALAAYSARSSWSTLAARAPASASEDRSARRSRPRPRGPRSPPAAVSSASPRERRHSRLVGGPVGGGLRPRPAPVGRGTRVDTSPGG
eukprot:5606814-Prymnesium_polylepis.1